VFSDSRLTVTRTVVGVFVRSSIFSSFFVFSNILTVSEQELKPEESGNSFGTIDDFMIVFNKSDII
jgi:hypothetical protein